MISKRFKEYFNYTKKERNGLIVLLIILIALIAFNIYVRNKSYGELVLLDEDFEKEVAEFESSLQEIEKEAEHDYSVKKRIANKRKQKWKRVDSLFVFDPNKINKTNLRKLGFSSSQANTIINFRNKGGVFYKKEDLLKIYGVEEEQYKYLDSYIEIENIKEEYDTAGVAVKYVYQEELNSAKIDDLIKLKGIGESYAKRIIKYRDLLGGYSELDQLNEVYGMDSVKISNISNSLQIDEALIEKMNINKVQFKTLLKHPYINKYQTQSIMKYREISGKFSRIEQLVEYNLIDQNTFYRIKPYLTVNDSINN